MVQCRVMTMMEKERVPKDAGKHKDLAQRVFKKFNHISTTMVIFASLQNFIVSLCRITNQCPQKSIFKKKFLCSWGHTCTQAH